MYRKIILNVQQQVTYCIWCSYPTSNELSRCGPEMIVMKCLQRQFFLLQKLQNWKDSENFISYVMELNDFWAVRGLISFKCLHSFEGLDLSTRRIFLQRRPNVFSDIFRLSSWKVGWRVGSKSPFLDLSILPVPDLIFHLILLVANLFHTWSFHSSSMI